MTEQTAGRRLDATGPACAGAVTDADVRRALVAYTDWSVRDFAGPYAKDEMTRLRRVLEADRAALASARPPGAEAEDWDGLIAELCRAVEDTTLDYERGASRRRSQQAVADARRELREAIDRALAVPAPAEADIAALTARVTERFGCAGPVPLFAVTATVRDVVAFVADALAAPAPAPAPVGADVLNMLRKATTRLAILRDRMAGCVMADAHALSLDEIPAWIEEQEQAIDRAAGAPARGAEGAGDA